MIGLLMIAIAIGWLIAAIAITTWIAARAKSPPMKAAVSVLVFPLALIAPVVDEVIGAWQFSALCKQYAVQTIDVAHAMNRRVLYVLRGADRFAEGTAVRIRIDPIVYRDAETGLELVSYHTLHAEGGWLIRTLGISETKSPLLFGRGCGPENQDAFKKKFNITVIN